MELKFRRKLSINGHGHYYMHIPPAIADALNCEYVDLVCNNGTLVIVPVPRREA
jgi:hypothetical protein